MPRFLGLDYLTEALCQKRQFLNRSVLTVPQHLAHIESYVHSGALPDSLYRVPWKNAEADLALLSKEASKASSDLSFLQLGCNSPQIESLDSDWIKAKEDEEFVPSSNPESQEWEPERMHLAVNNETDEETFEKHVFNQDVDERCLEETILSEPLLEHLHNLPLIGNLLNRLQKDTVSDPLTEQKLVDHPTALFKEDKVYSQQKPREQVYSPDFAEEVFNKIPLHAEDDDSKSILEETICEFGLPPLAKKSAIKDLVQSLETEPQDDEPEPLSVLKDISRQNAAEPQVEKLELSLPEIKLATFVDINGGCDFEELPDARPHLLTEPITDTVSDATHTPLIPLSKDLGQLKPEPMDNEEDICFLTPKTKDSLLKQHWDHEKFLDETLALRLSEPDILSEKAVLGSPVEEARALLVPVELNVSIDEEIELPWDPFAKLKNQSRRQTLESISFNELSERDCPLHHSEKTLEFEEKIEKFPNAMLHDWTDPLLEIPKPDSRMGKLKEAILARQKDNMSCAVPISLRSQTRMWDKQTSVRRKPTESDSAGKSFSQKDFKKNTEDPLNNFLRMRFTEVSQPTVGHIDEQCWPQEKENSSGIGRMSLHSSPEKSRNRVITVPITGEFGELAQVLSESSGPSIAHLQEAGTLPQHQHLATIPPDMTRFLLKQMIRQGADSVTQTSMTILHIVSCVYNVFLHCSLKAAIYCLSAMEEKYQEQIAGKLAGLRQRLSQTQCSLKTSNQLHPKLRELCSYTENWLMRKKNKDQDSDPKIMVLVRRDLEGLLTQISRTLAMSRLITPAVYTEKDTSYNTLLNTLDQANCVVVAGECVGATFPWSQFSLVVEYEHQPQTGWQDTCLRQNIRYLGLKVDANAVSRSRPPQGRCYGVLAAQVIMVCSQRVTANTELLQLLENRFNAVVVERNYSILGVAGDEREGRADIILDAVTSVCLQDTAKLANHRQLGAIYNKMAAFYQRYTKVWLVFYHATGSNRPPDHILSANVSKLQSALSNFTVGVEDFSVELMMCKDVAEVAKVVNAIGNSVQNGAEHSIWTTDISQQDLTPDEKHLLIFPCFNSLSAQLVLKSHSLSQLMDMTLEELTSEFPNLPLKVLKTFHSLKSEKTNERLSDKAPRDDDLGEVVPGSAAVLNSESEDFEVAEIVQSPRSGVSEHASYKSEHTDVRSPSPNGQLPLSEHSGNSSHGNSDLYIHGDQLKRQTVGCGVPHKVDSMRKPEVYMKRPELQQTCPDTTSGYGDFDISLSPTLQEIDTVTDVSLYEDRVEKDDSQNSKLEDSEENSFPKPNEFTMAEIEGQTIIDNCALKTMAEPREISPLEKQRYGNDHLQVFQDGNSLGNNVEKSYSEHGDASPGTHLDQQSISAENSNYMRYKQDLGTFGRKDDGNDQQGGYFMGTQGKKVSRNRNNSLNSVPSGGRSFQNYKQQSRMDNNFATLDTIQSFKVDDDKYVSEFMNSMKNAKARNPDHDKTLESHDPVMHGSAFSNRSFSTATTDNSARGAINQWSRNRQPQNFSSQKNHESSAGFDFLSMQNIPASYKTNGRKTYGVMQNSSRDMGNKQFGMGNVTEDDKGIHRLNMHGRQTSHLDNDPIPWRNQGDISSSMISSSSQRLQQNWNNSARPLHPLQNLTDYSSSYSYPCKEELQNKSFSYSNQQNVAKHRSSYSYWEPSDQSYQREQKVPDNSRTRLSVCPPQRFDNYTIRQPMHITPTPPKPCYPNSQAWANLPGPGENHMLHHRYLPPPTHRVSVGLAQPLPRNPQPPEAQKPTQQPLNDENDSPPMDLDSDEENQASFKMQAVRQPYNVNANNNNKSFSHQQNMSRIPTNGRQRLRGMPSQSYTSGVAGVEPNMLSLIPSKKKRLGLERMPGAKDGQTRLSFI